MADQLIDKGRDILEEGSEIREEGSSIVNRLKESVDDWKDQVEKKSTNYSANDWVCFGDWRETLIHAMTFHDADEIMALFFRAGAGKQRIKGTGAGTVRCIYGSGAVL